MRNKLVIGAIALTLTGTSLFAATTSFAQDATNNSDKVVSFQDRQESLVQSIADKFNLKKEDVQAVFDEHHKTMHAQMEQRLEERLNTAVSEGKLTEDQKQKILAKMKELRAEKEQMKIGPDNSEERKTFHKELKSDLKAWAEENGIPMEYLFVGFGHKGMGLH